MKIFSAVLAVSLALSIVSLSSFVQAPRPYRGFVISMPEIVDVAPGSEAFVNGGVTNIGTYWSHQVYVYVTGLPEGYNATAVPNYFEDVRTLRQWDPVNGTVKVPEKLDLIINAPSNAVPGLYTVNVTLQETQSARLVTNYTVFVLHVSGEAPSPEISVTNINVPEQVTEFKPFSLSFDVSNQGASDTSVNLTVVGPSGWTYEPSEISDVVVSKSSKSFAFNITPTNESGSFSVVLKYPFQGVIINVTKSGPFLAVVSEAAGTPGLPGISLPALPPISGSMFNDMINFASTNPLITVVILVIIAILVYYFYTTYTLSMSRRKPEEMKKQVEIEPQKEKSELEGMKEKIVGEKIVDTSSESTAVSKA